MVLCTDPAEYPKDMHYHKKFQAKDMHLSAFLAEPVFAFIPLSWFGTPVMRRGRIYWGEILSKCTQETECVFHLFINLK